MENEAFHSDVDKMFKSYLEQGEKPVIRVCENGKVLTKMPYHKVLFDADLNIFKKNDDGTVTRVDDPKFTAVVVTAS